MTQVITAFFDERSAADRAVTELVNAGVSRSSIRLMPESGSASSQQTSTSTSTSTSYDTGRDEKGFWGSLGELFMPDEDRHTYAEALHRGSIMVSATVEDAQATRAEDILEEYGTVDIDERQGAWRQQGWTGFTGATKSDTGAASTALSSGIGAGGRSAKGNEEVIPVAEESLRVGKRQVRQGRVRVRSYVVETPVQEQVNLHNEHVTIERRGVDRPLAAGDRELFRERTIEAEERGEEAVVSKEARIKEELVLRKDVTDRAETVKDTVRRTEVEVDDDRTAAGAPGKATTTPTNKPRVMP